MGRGLARTLKVSGLAITLAVVLGGLAPVARAEWTPRRDLLSWINTARADHGSRALSGGWRLRDLANAHSRRMADAGRIFHTPSLGSRLTFLTWRTAGENVGAGTSMRSLYDAFMRSSPHRANILASSYRRIGIGVYRADGFLWVTMVFVG
jgi:uncharacterized protein YkwD